MVIGRGGQRTSVEDVEAQALLFGWRPARSTY